MPLTIEQYLSQGPASSKEIQAATGLQQRVVSRRIQAFGDKILRIPSGRSPLYALSKNAFGAGHRVPLYRIDAHGNAALVADIRPLAHGGFYVEKNTGMSPLLLGEAGNGLYADLPWFLDDLRPQGFLGRQIARALAEQSGEFPEDPRQWNSNHVARYLIGNGDDLPGSFQLGAASRSRLRRPPLACMESDYPALAAEVMAGIIPGSSAGGEQPKFTCYSSARSAHVIVKFSMPDDNPVVQRWRDILITEFHASQTIHAAGLPAARTRLHDIAGQLFLESERFDRNGEYGRLSMLSLMAIDAEFTGLGSDWPSAVKALQEQGLVSEEQLHSTALLWAFGRCINNTDMHYGNLSFAIDGDVFRLLPVYDMCAMGFAPVASSGAVPPYDFTVRKTPAKGLLSEQQLSKVLGMAGDFWQRVAGEPRASDQLRHFAQNMADQCSNQLTLGLLT